VSTLAHVFEAAGIATVTLSSMIAVTEKMSPPRSLFGEFPLGRPLGKPDDPEFQHDVLARAFALLDAPSGPVIETHPEVISADETALICSIPATYDPSRPRAVDEAIGIRGAYDRSLAARGVTSVGRVVDADGVVDILGALDRIVNGEPWKEAGLPGDKPNTIALCHDLRTYYEEAALELVDGPPPDGRAAEAWFFDDTEAGQTVLAARRALQEQGAPHPVWFYMAPAHRN